MSLEPSEGLVMAAVAGDLRLEWNQDRKRWCVKGRQLDMHLARVALQADAPDGLAAESWTSDCAILSMQWQPQDQPQLQLVLGVIRDAVVAARTKYLRLEGGRVVMWTKCGQCRQEGHWKTECPLLQEHKERTLALPPEQSQSFRRFADSPFCFCDQREGPSVLPRVVCLFCQHACCAKAKQRKLFPADFQCDIHGGAPIEPPPDMSRVGVVPRIAPFKTQSQV
jgi:hypothetical protein